MKIWNALTCVSLLLLVGCVQGPTHGPDKQFEGELTGASSGAAAGAITGFHVGAGTGPGALVGAGLGAVAGGVRGLAQDTVEENLLAMSAQTSQERETARVHEILQDHYQRRLELHPSRDIYPADLFFAGDSSKLCPQGVHLVEEIARMNEYRYPWSRLVVAVYVRSNSQEEEVFAKTLADLRSRAVTNRLVRGGVEPRRIETRGVVVNAPLVIDPADDPLRYNQAVEFIPLDR